MHHLVRVFVFVGLAACGPTASGPAAPSPGAPADSGKTYPVPALTGQVDCWHGTGQVEFATGQEQGNIEMYVRRGFDAGVVTEDSLSVVNGAASRNWQTVKVDGAALVVDGKYKGGTFKGTGSAVGDAPAWASWIIDIELDAGAKVHSEYRSTGTGIDATSVVSDASGNAMMQFTVQLSGMDATACESVYARHEPL